MLSVIVKRIIWIVVSIAMVLPLFGCESTQEVEGLHITGPGDLAYFTLLINEWVDNNGEIPKVSMTLSADSIGELKSGKCDAVLLGREPTVEELQGLRDFVIAFDAVCLIIDQSSYTGGVKDATTYPTVKTAGLQTISSNDVAAWLTTGYQWTGDYYTSKSGIDLTSTLWTLEGGKYAWVQVPKRLTTSFVFPQGKYDTQTILYQSLGLNESQLLSGHKEFTCPKYSLEEEVISSEYNSSKYSLEYGIQDFLFKTGFASRRAMTLATERAPVKVLAVNGIDPLSNPQAVYDGTYPFSRKIHLLIRESESGEAKALGEFLISEQGQQFISDSGYLPVVQKPAPNK